MRRLCAWCFMVISFQGFSQTYIEPFPVLVAFNKTTSLIFPYPIKQVTMGSRDVIGQVLQAADTILQVKAAKKDFPETNMQVITADGELRSFTLRYSNSPEQLTIAFPRTRNVDLPHEQVNDVALANASLKILVQKKFIRVTAKTADLKIQLRSIYFYEQSLWFVFDIRNFSQVDFAPASIRFFLRDKHKIKRTAIQETDISIIYRPPIIEVHGDSRKLFAIACKPFGIPEGKRLVCSFGEDDGNRRLSLRLDQRKLLLARAALR